MYILLRDFDSSQPVYVNTNHITRIEFDEKFDLFRLHLSDKAMIQCSFSRNDEGKYRYPDGELNFLAYLKLKSLVERGNT